VNKQVFERLGLATIKQVGSTWAVVSAKQQSSKLGVVDDEVDVGGVEGVGRVRRVGGRREVRGYEGSLQIMSQTTPLSEGTRSVVKMMEFEDWGAV
jgi:hypothetical protein